MSLFNNIYKNKKVWISGHTGFKGSWLTLWLLKLGAIVKGYSLPPFKKECHFNLLNFEQYKNFENEFGDIRDYNKLQNSIRSFKPDVIFHLAAQAIVKIGYTLPLYTIETNVMGTSNLLDICRHIDSIKALLMITTDKVYKDDGRNYNYSENDALGGDDAYSSSKASAEIIIDAYKKSYYDEKNILISPLRAGNVIAGGDISDYRIIPDIVKSKISDSELILRNPSQIRPWHYVLDCLKGYLMVGQKLLEGKKKFATSWNFASNVNDFISVEELVNIVNKYWSIKYKISSEKQVKETKILKLNSFKSRCELGWKPLYNIEKIIEETIKWYREYYENNRIITEKQIDEYATKI